MRSREAAPVAVTPLPVSLPVAIVDRLRTNGLTSCQEWLALGAKRGQLFGITKKIRKQIDRAVAAAIERKRP
jgi:hypothetical protein